MAALAALIVAIAGLISAAGVAVVALLKVLFARGQSTPESRLYEQYNDHIERLEKEIERLSAANSRLREERDGKTQKSDS